MVVKCAKEGVNNLGLVFALFPMIGGFSVRLILIFFALPIGLDA